MRSLSRAKKATSWCNGKEERVSLNGDGMSKTKQIKTGKQSWNHFNKQVESGETKVVTFMRENWKKLKKEVTREVKEQEKATKRWGWREIDRVQLLFWTSLRIISGGGTCYSHGCNMWWWWNDTNRWWWWQLDEWVKDKMMMINWSLESRWIVGRKKNEIWRWSWYSPSLARNIKIFCIAVS